MNNPLPRVTVLMPTFEHSHFIRRALDSLLAQSMEEWELVIVDDGSADDTDIVLAPHLRDQRIRYLRLPHNTGLGKAINEGMARARAQLIAYLPSDDLWYREHLHELCDCLSRHPDAVLAFSGVRHHYNRHAEGKIDGAPLQLVQCMHRATALRWTARAELESDDLHRLFWRRLRAEGMFVGTRSVSCEWVDHPGQRHKIMQEPAGGINSFRQRYRVAHPLRFHASTGNAIDEEALYRPLRSRGGAVLGGGLRIVLAGELAYNAERVLALEERGHSLHGLWMERPYWYNTVGPLPFGNVRDIARANWREALHALEPDLIYAQLNWQAVPFCHEVMMATPAIPFVWHFKEGPFICMEKGTWPLLAELFLHADGCIFASPEMRDWFDTAIPGLSRERPCHVLAGDLPKKEWFERPCSARVAATGDELHTVVPGRPIGLHPHTVAELASHDIHLHFYGDFTQGQWRAWIDKSMQLAGAHLHLHANVAQDRWVEEFSRYDAGWLHAFDSKNGGDIRHANWDDLNYPARMATLAVAGLPMIQRRNEGAIVASAALTKKLGIGLFYDTIDELASQLRQPGTMRALREQVWQTRMQFSFDHHVPALEAFFHAVIERAAVAPAARGRKA